MRVESEKLLSEELDILNKPISDALSRRLIENGERRSLIGTVPLSRVVTDHSLIDEHHVEELANSMRSSDRGQISPTTMRARIDEETNEVLFDVVDGFHRTEALRRIGADTIKVSAMYSCSDEELYDLRILAAQSVQSVQYARIATWMRLAFDSTPWAAKGMDVTHAFGITLNDTKRPQKVDFSPQEVEEMKDWVKGTANRWSRGLAQTYQTLKLVDEADPALVEQVRTQGGGKDRKAVVTPTLLKLTVESFPGAENYDAQNAVMDVILDKRYYVPQARAFIDQVAPFLHEGMSKEEVTNAIHQHVDFESIGVVFEKQKTKKTTTEVRDVSRRHRKNLAESRDQVKELQKTIDEKDRTIHVLRGKVSQLEEEKASLSSQVYSLKQQVAALKVGRSIVEESKPMKEESSNGRYTSTVKVELYPTKKITTPKKEPVKPPEVVVSPEQIQANFVKSFSELRIPTMVGGFFLTHEKYIKENDAEAIDPEVVDALGEAFDQANPDPTPISSENVHTGRIEGLTLLKQFVDLSGDLQKKALDKLPLEVQQLVEYGVYLDKAKLLPSLVSLAKEEKKDKHGN